MTDDMIRNLGPLAALAGTWEGDQGDDTAPSDDRGTEKNKFRERRIFEPIGLVENHEQKLYGLKYSTMAWRLGEADAFHQDAGYWLWDAKVQQVMRCFVVPRGVVVLVGGTVKPGAKTFKLSAKVGSHTYGICSNRFLDKEFKTVGYELKITVHGESSFSYDEDTQLKLKGRAKIFHHRDKNTVTRVPDR